MWHCLDENGNTLAMFEDVIDAYEYTYEHEVAEVAYIN